MEKPELSGKGASSTKKACWTCRLRRKKCDRALPTCESCSHLNVTCHRSAGKPVWMDGGSKQKDMVQKIKSQIRNKANGRSRKPIEFHIASQYGSLRSNHTGSATPAAVNAMKQGASEPEQSLDSTATSTAVTTIEGPSNQLYAALGKAWELDFIMIYVDYVFPFLFPFYHPPIVATSRSWLLSFIRQNRSILHSVLSLSSFFFTFGLKDIFQEEHNLCRITMWGQVVDQARMSFGMLQVDLANLTADDSDASLLKKVQMIETIVHLTIYDLSVGRSPDWELHLSPAMALFEDIWGEASKATPDEPGLACILRRMEWPRPRFPGFNLQLWNPDQACFRFFVANLLFMDIIASTSLGRAPRLGKFHTRLIGDVPREQIREKLDFYAFVGCQNWILLAISEITALDVWKKEMQQADKSRLHLSANYIRQTLDQGLTGLEATSHRTTGTEQVRVGQLQPYYFSDDRGPCQADLLAVTKAWAHAAQTYLHVVAFGWDLFNSTLRRHVSEVSKAASQVSSIPQLRSMSWPICVAGCLAYGEAEKAVFRAVVSSVGDLEVRSAMSEAGSIMERVWNRGEAQLLDIEACLGILGRPVLLI